MIVKTFVSDTFVDVLLAFPMRFSGANLRNLVALCTSPAIWLSRSSPMPLKANSGSCHIHAILLLALRLQIIHCIGFTQQFVACCWAVFVVLGFAFNKSQDECFWRIFMVKARVLSALIQTFAILLLAASVFGQETTAGLQGTVKDSTGAVVANAHVVVTGNSLTGNKASDTDGSGYYRFANLPPGT